MMYVKTLSKNIKDVLEMRRISMIITIMEESIKAFEKV